MIKIKANPTPPFEFYYKENGIPTGTWLIINIGGRGSSKSYETAKFSVLKATYENKRVVVLRDEQINLAQSIFNKVV